MDQVSRMTMRRARTTLTQSCNGFLQKQQPTHSICAAEHKQWDSRDERFPVSIAHPCSSYVVHLFLPEAHQVKCPEDGQDEPAGPDLRGSFTQAVVVAPKVLACLTCVDHVEDWRGHPA